MYNIDKIKYNINKIRDVLPQKTRSFKYIGSPINHKTLKDFIIESKMSDEDIILLHSHNFCDIIEEYRSIYKASIPIPYKLLGVYIEEAQGSRVPKDRVSVIKINNHHL